VTNALEQPVGFIGLGDMGGPIAGNMAKGFTLRVYDKAGTEARAPKGAQTGSSTADLAATCKTICMCVPDGAIANSIAKEIIDAPNRVTTVVIDHSTTGVQHARDNASLLAEAGITYVDSPVSGGRAGAAAGTITMIWGGSGEVLDSHRALIEAASGNIFHVGPEPGQGQAVKLLNNFLSGTAMAATAEAVAFGVAQGVDMKTILDVVNVSTGMNTATKDKYINRVLTETYDAGFRTALMAKDIKLYKESVRETGTPTKIGTLVSDLWQDVDDARPGSDFSEVYKFVTGED